MHKNAGIALTLYKYFAENEEKFIFFHCHDAASRLCLHLWEV